MQRRSGPQNTSGSRKTRNRVIADVVRRASAATVEPLENRWMLNGIGFNFTGGSTGQGSSPRAMGTSDSAGPFDVGGASGPLFAGNSAYVQAFWNNNAGANGSQTSGVTDSTGATLATTVTWSSAGTWASVTNPPADGYETINSGFLNSGGTGTPVTITINNIPYSQYDVYVYELNDGSGRISTTTAYGVSYVGSSPDPHGSIPGPTGTQFYVDSDPTTPYAYVLASSRATGTNGTANADLVRFQMEGGTSFTVSEVAPGNGYVNAIQIVDTSGDTTKPDTVTAAGQNSTTAAIVTWQSSVAAGQAAAGGYSYIIMRGTATNTETPYTTLSASPGLTSFSDTGATPANTTFFYKVIAVSPDGTQSAAASNEVTAEIDANAPPGPVSGLTAVVDNPAAPTAIILN